jgi:hypothetical protein
MKFIWVLVNNQHYETGPGAKKQQSAGHLFIIQRYLYHPQNIVQQNISFCSEHSGPQFFFFLILLLMRHHPPQLFVSGYTEEMFPLMGTRVISIKSFRRFHIGSDTVTVHKYIFICVLKKLSI